MRQSPAPASTVSRLKLPRLVRMAGESGIIPRRCAAATPFRFAPLRSPSQPRWSLWGSRHAGEAHTQTAPQATAWSDYRRAPPGYAPRLAAQSGKTNGAKPGSGFYGFPAAAATFSKDIRGKQCHSAPLDKPRYRPQGTGTRAKPIHGQHRRQPPGVTTVLAAPRRGGGAEGNPPLERSAISIPVGTDHAARVPSGRQAGITDFLRQPTVHRR